MRARVLFTDGEKTRDLFWIHHTGQDVYWGSPRYDGKTSYHASGKVHHFYKGERAFEYWHTPLQELQGIFFLSSFTLANLDVWFEDEGPLPEYSAKKSDAVLIIDRRSFQTEPQFTISIGLLQPHNTDMLDAITRPTDGARILVPNQILIATAVTPWVYAVLSFWRDAS